MNYLKRGIKNGVAQWAASFGFDRAGRHSCAIWGLLIIDIG